MAALTSVPAGVHNRPCVGARPIASDRLMCRSLSSRKVRTVPKATAAPAAQAKAGEISKQVIEDERKYILHTYARTPIVLSHGSGAKLYDVEGNEYLDFTSGIAVNALGHADPRWVETVSEQAALLAHTSNLFHTLPQVELAKRLVENSFADKAFFANSGTEANEAAIKFARKFAKVQAGVDPYNPEEAARAPSGLLGFTGSFHGRTLGALSLTYKSQYRTPFSPLTPGSKLVPYGDLAAARAELASGSYAAVFVEPVQGEGGINDAGPEFLKGLRALCNEFGVLLVFDEVQVGLGRTGHLFAYERSGVEPDMMTLAKPLAGGLPIGAVLLKQRVADTMAPGDHGSTFAGNPLVCKAAITTLDIIRDPAFLADVRRKGEALKTGLTEALKGNSHVKEVRGAGLIIGIQLDQPAGKVVEAAKQRGLLIITAGKGDVVRLVPPLVVSDEEVQQAIQIISEAVAETLI